MIPNVRTDLPGPESKKYIEMSLRYEPRSMSDQVPVVWKRAEGAVIEDVDGNVFIDFTSGVLVANIGHSHPKHVAAVRDQAGLVMNSYDFVTPWRAKLAEKLVELTAPNLDRAFILTTGGEATEAAIRLARRYTGRYEIIGFHGGFHGRTYGAASAGGKSAQKQGFGPMVPGFLHAPFCYCYRCVFGQHIESCDYLCLKYLDRLLETESSGSVAAVITESYQGGAGSIVPTPEFMQRLQTWCRERDILFILDEVQSSFGRTGKMFAYEHFGIQPNLLCVGKGLGSGVPTSALLGESRIMDVLEPGSMSSTSGGNPLCARGALAAIEIIEEEKLVENSAKIGAMLMDAFNDMKRDYEIVGDVRGMGLAIGIEIVRDKAGKEPAPDLTKEIIMRAARRGLMLIAAIGFYGNVIRIAPPLMISEELAVRGAQILAESIAEVMIENTPPST